TWFDKILKDDDVTEIEYSYENREEIGKGGFGIVYSAFCNGKKFALKSFINDETNKEATKEFIRELKYLHAISNHPNINQFYGITREGYREPTIPGTPRGYSDIYKKCWSSEPKERPTINKILEKLNLMSKEETMHLIINSNRELKPELDEKISERSQFYKNMHNDELSRNLLRAVSVQKPRRPSRSSAKSSDSLTKS
ncbi:18649_t:CDS:2, partial [Racocetra persica]